MGFLVIGSRGTLRAVLGDRIERHKTEGGGTQLVLEVRRRIMRGEGRVPEVKARKWGWEARQNTSGHTERNGERERERERGGSTHPILEPRSCARCSRSQGPACWLLLCVSYWASLGELGGEIFDIVSSAESGNDSKHGNMRQNARQVRSAGGRIRSSTKRQQTNALGNNTTYHDHQDQRSWTSNRLP